MIFNYNLSIKVFIYDIIEEKLPHTRIQILLLNKY